MWEHWFVLRTVPRLFMSPMPLQHARNKIYHHTMFTYGWVSVFHLQAPTSWTTLPEPAYVWTVHVSNRVCILSITFSSPPSPLGYQLVYYTIIWMYITVKPYASGVAVNFYQPRRWNSHVVTANRSGTLIETQVSSFYLCVNIPFSFRTYKNDGAKYFC